MIWNFIKSVKNNYLNKKNIKIISLGVLLVLFIAILVYKKIICMKLITQQNIGLSL